MARARAWIDARALIPSGAGVLVGVSGGADSVALLSVLKDLARDQRRAYRLSVGHLDHGLRPASRDDAAFVRELGRRWAVPVVVERADVAGQARRDGRGIEDAARAARYRFLCAAAQDASADVVAVGHHADDNAETILYRVCRGTHLRGLAGMPARRSLGGGATLVRPLLTARREEIEAYCRRRGLQWRTDPTNAETRHRRNAVRHELLPWIRQRLNPRVDEALLRLARAAAEVDTWADGQAVAALDAAVRVADPGRVVLRCEPLRALPEVLQTYALRAAAERAGVPLRALGAERLAELAATVLSDGPPAVALPGGFEARRRGDVLTVARVEPASADVAAVELDAAGTTRLGDGRRVEARVEPLDRDAFAAHCRARRRGAVPGEAWLDADAVRGRPIARSRRDGDAFVPLGAPGRQTVSDFLTNAKLPHEQRSGVVCVCDELGVVWVAPLRIDDRVKVTDTTRRVLRLVLRGP
ncbi:MAG: tRNA lysidine(34) synthetase TilS [Planctomycetota bacterium]